MSAATPIAALIAAANRNAAVRPNDGTSTNPASSAPTIAPVVLTP
jgi:hypothetical protein